MTFGFSYLHMWIWASFLNTDLIIAEQPVKLGSRVIREKVFLYNFFENLFKG